MALILIVEDNEKVAAMYQRQLEFEGHTVAIAKDGVNGTSMAKKIRPDLILLDIILPQKSGLDMLVDLKGDAKTKSIPVVAISAFGSEENERQAKELGAVEFLEKEKIDPDFVGKVVKKYLKR